MTDAQDPAPPPASPLWRAWQGATLAQRLLGGLALGVLAVVGVLALTDDRDQPVTRTTTSAASASPSPSAPPAPSASPSPVEPSATPSPTASAVAPSPSTATVPPPAAPTPSASPTPAPGELQLGGDELGVTRVGAPDAEAVRAVTAVLGPPLADPAPVTACVGAGDREVEWAEFRLAVTDGVVSGWLSRDPDLTTPSGVGIGTTVTEMQEVYGDRLELYEANPDSGPGFTVGGVELGGGLTGPGGDDRVVALWNRACSPP